MNITDKNLLDAISDFSAMPAGAAFNVRKNGQKLDRRSTEHVQIVTKEDKPGIDIRIKAHNLVDTLLYEIVGTRGVRLVILHQGHPEGTGDTRDLNIGMEFLDFEGITLTLDGSLCGEDAHMA